MSRSWFERTTLALLTHAVVEAAYFLSRYPLIIYLINGDIEYQVGHTQKKAETDGRCNRARRLCTPESADARFTENER
jgi:hypothetical protein